MIKMEHIALTSLSNNVVTDLKNHVLRTVEFRSPHNFISILNIDVGDIVFLTHSNPEDIATGTNGIIAQVKKRSIVMHKTIQGNHSHYEEQEVLIARVQFATIGMGRIYKIECNELGKALLVDANEIACFDAR